MILAEIYLIICTLFLASKDALSYLLKDKVDTDLTKKRIAKWHRDGVILFLLYILAALSILVVDKAENWWLIFPYSALIRLSIFDIAFNYWAGLDPKFLGSTSKVDQFFVKIVGQDGAIKKSAIFLVILLLLNLIFI